MLDTRRIKAGGFRGYFKVVETDRQTNGDRGDR